MKHKRGADHKWEVRMYMGDGAYYAHCKCGFYYGCGDCMHERPWKIYQYCPNCGARKKWYNAEVVKMERMRQ